MEIIIAFTEDRIHPKVTPGMTFMDIGFIYLFLNGCYGTVLPTEILGRTSSE